ncbi:MAG: hypothetical protein ABL931_05730 [Usitatibacteraceae bacterium]
MKRLSTAAICAFALISFSSAHAASFSAALEINDSVGPEQTGLRIYPGATLIAKGNNESEAANIQFSFGDFGLKVVAAKLRSSDSPEKVAAFYRGELARFGEVLDCGKSSDGAEPPTSYKKSKVLKCDKDRPKKGGMLYKVGRKDDQHVVEVRSRGEGSEISLVHVNVRTPD